MYMYITCAGSAGRCTPITLSASIGATCSSMCRNQCSIAESSECQCSNLLLSIAVIQLVAAVTLLAVTADYVHAQCATLTLVGASMAAVLLA
eukprot:6516-Heterococcus_DN1.PRE.1